MTAIRFVEEIELRMQLPLLIYPTHFYNPIIPNIALTELGHYCIVDTIGSLLSGNKTLSCKKGLIGTPRLHVLHVLQMRRCARVTSLAHLTRTANVNSRINFPFLHYYHNVLHL